MEIHIGYTVGDDPQPFTVDPKHMIVTGMTGVGKGILDETIVRNWPGQKVLVFVTKEAEEQFTSARKITPFFKQLDAGDWRSIRDLVEVSEDNETLSKDEKALLAQVCAGAEDLKTVIKRVKQEMDAQIGKGGRKGRNYNSLYMLHEYLTRLDRSISKYTFASALDLQEGINVMDISGIMPEFQSAIVGAALDEVHYARDHVTCLIMDSAKIIPFGKNSPALRPAKLITEEGRVKNNWLIFDVQHLKGLHADVKPNVDNYFLSKQKHVHEIERMREALEMDPDQVPTLEQIKGLEKGQFWVLAGKKTALVYVKPWWMPDDVALKCAKDPSYVDSEEVKRYEAKVRIDVVLSKDSKSATLHEKVDGPVAFAMDETLHRASDGITKAHQGVFTAVDKVWVEEYVGKAMEKMRTTFASEIAHLRELIGNPMPGISVTGGPAEIRVKSETKTLDFDSNTIEGQIVLMVQEGYFDRFQTVNPVRKEVGRRLVKPGVDYYSVQKALKMLASPGYRLLVMGTRSNRSLEFKSAKAVAKEKDKQ